MDSNPKDRLTSPFAAWNAAWADLQEPPTGWTETHKLRPTGDGHRDRLVAARINLRRSE